MRRAPLDIDTLWSLDRVGGITLAPDGSAAACAVTSFSMEENTSRTSLWLLPTAECAPRRLTSAGDKDGAPSFSPQGDRIAFLARREQEGKKDAERQLYVIGVAGGEARRMSDFAPGVEEFKWMPDGKRIAFISWVWPELRGAKAQAKRHKEFAERKEGAYVTSESFYRYWDRNLPMGRVPHLHLLDLDSGRVTDLFEGTGYELPRADPSASHFDISPDGRRIAFVHDPRERKRADQPCALAEIDVRTRRVTPLTRDAQWNFDAPRYSPDGARLACLAANVGWRHTAPNQLAILKRGGRWKIHDRRDVDPEGPLRWADDGSALYFAAQQRGRRHLWRCDAATAALDVTVAGGWVQDFALAGGRLVAAIDCAEHPPQVHAIEGAGSRRLERFNEDQLAALQLGETREVTVRGARGDPVQMFVTFPPRFDPRRRHPVLHLIHGGPYAAAGDLFGLRWSPHLFAAHGYVVASVNYHGSSGFGHDFHHCIMGRQGQYETEDIEAGTVWLLKQPWADRRRVFASGGSYGGFLVAWMNGHVRKGRYQAYVCHAGVFDRVATFSADSYANRPKDLHALYYEDPARVRAQSPVAFAQHMDTPTLVIHGTNDYRVPDTNGLAYYNTLQMRGVPSRLVWFADEGHWVLKPRNSKLWYREFLDFLAAHDPGEARRRR